MHSQIYDLGPPQTLEAVGGLADLRRAHTATLLDNGSVLMTTGDYFNDRYRTAEIFDPVSKSYMGAGATTVSHIGHTATKLPNGTVVIIGGNINDGLIELYGATLPTPASLTIAPSPVTVTTGTTVAFTATDDLARPRYDATWTVSDPSKASLTVTGNGASLTALTLGQVTLTADIDAVQAQASVTIAPQSLRITPAKATLLGGHQRQFSVVDELGRPSPLATWTLSDEALATITSDSSPVLTALNPGQVTLTATVLGVTMTAEVTILAGTTYPQGTVHWSAPVVPGFIPDGIVQTVMFGPDSTATYTVQRRADEGESLVQAFTEDGRQAWERRLRPLLGKPVSDGKGGLLVTEACDDEHPVQLSALDETTGGVKWYTQIAPQYVGTGCPTHAPQIAIRHDGAVAFSAPPNTLPSFAVVSDAGDLGRAAVGSAVDGHRWVGPDILPAGDDGRADRGCRQRDLRPIRRAADSSRDPGREPVVSAEDPARWHYEHRGAGDLHRGQPVPRFAAAGWQQRRAGHVDGRQVGCAV